MNNITFILFTYNEEKRIAYAIKNFIQYGEVFIFDGGSTDKTQEIAEKFGAKFFTRPASDKPQSETNKNFEFVKSKINTDWIYWGYVDNIAPKSLVEKLVEVSKQDHYKMVLIPLYTYLWGDTNSFALKSYSPMFYHKDFIDYTDNHIHGMGKFLGRKEQLLKLSNKSEYALRHFSTYDIHKFVLGHLCYAKQEALEKHSKGKKFSTIKMLAAIIRYCWIYRRSFKNGIQQGFVVVLAYASFRIMAHVKLYELEKGITLESIENNYSIVKEKILKEFE